MEWKGKERRLEAADRQSGSSARSFQRASRGHLAGSRGREEGRGPIPRPRGREGHCRKPAGRGPRQAPKKAGRALIARRNMPEAQRAVQGQALEFHINHWYGREQQLRRPRTQSTGQGAQRTVRRALRLCRSKVPVVPGGGPGMYQSQ